MDLSIRQETPDDFPAVKNVIAAAFKEEPLSDQSEPLLVERLRALPTFIPELSLVADLHGEIVGHILLTKVQISNAQNNQVLALAPVSVHPEYQRRGIGAELIQTAHKIAKRLGYRAVVLIGHEHYYPRFGYQTASNYQITFPFDAPDVNCMVLSLTEEGLADLHGEVQYSQPFYQ